MKTLPLIAAICLAATQALAEEQHFTCVSDRDGHEVRLSRPVEGDKGTITFHDTAGEATVLHGLDGVTFLHIKDKEVWTFVIHFPTMTYELSVHGAKTDEDHGKCAEEKA